MAKNKQQDKELRNEWIALNPSDEYGYWDCYLQIARMCPKRLTEQTMVLDHVIPKGRGKKYRNIDNLRPSCMFCNGFKGSRTLESLAKDFPRLRDA